MNQWVRDLINACPGNCCFIFGMTGDVRDIYGLLTQPVIRRMSRDPLVMEPLIPQDSVGFLKQVLKGYRSDPKGQASIRSKADALLAIAGTTQIRTPPELFRGCRRVLEKSILSGQLKPGGLIDENTVAETL